MELDYFMIGQRIRKYRKLNHFSQEQLAEMVDISIPHMSHIETANTKLSLQVLADIAEALHVRTDDLLKDCIDNSTDVKQDILDTLNTCTESQLLIIRDIIKTTKLSLDKHK